MRNYLLIILFALCCACTGGIEFGSLDASSNPGVDPSGVQFACQSPVQAASTANFSVVGCASMGAVGMQADGINTSVTDPLQELGSIILGE